MNPQYERFNEQLEQSIKGSMPGAERAGDASAEEVQGAELLRLARQFQETPHLRVDPVFAAQLERRMLRHALTRPRTARGWSLVQFWRLHRALAISMLLVLLLLGAGVLALVARTTNPASPLYGLGHWSQQARSTPTAAPADLAAADLQTARLRLLALQNVANATQTGTYVQGLASFVTQLARATGSINALPAGDEKTLLSTQLAQLKGDARQKLRGWLRTLTPAASAATTSELGRLGESIPQVSSASIVLPAHPRGNATVRVTGSGLQPGARLLVDGKLISVAGTLQNGQMVFVLTWTSEKHPRTLGIVNPDGTAAQTSNVTVTTASKNSNGNGQGK
ncbi:MAG TPA: hypothetical protein VF458_08475 [Ktedonobacteraceae bacterium]